MADEFVTVGTFGNTTEAHLAKSSLEKVGIQGFLENEFSVTMTPHMASPAGVKLLVKQSDAQKAAETLKPLA